MLASSKISSCAPRTMRPAMAPWPASVQQHAIRPRVAAQAQKQSFKSFDDMIENSDVPVLVDFYATWCGPCQILSASLANVSDRMKGKLQVVKIDTEKYPTIASKHRIQALPTLVLFKDGQPVDRIEGLLNEQQIVERVSYFLQQS